MERAGNGASGKRCDIDGVTRTGELAGVSESSRDIGGQTRKGERAGENESIGRPHVSANSTRDCELSIPSATMMSVFATIRCW